MPEGLISKPIVARIGAGFVFLLGVFLMAGTFYLAFSMFHDPQAGLFPPAGKNHPTSEFATQILIMINRIGLLFVMAYAGSSIASKGVALYEATRNPKS